MLIRPLELCWNRYQKGFSLMSFAFPDDTYYSFLAILKLEGRRAWWLSIGFYGWIVGVEEEDDNY